MDTFNGLPRPGGYIFFAESFFQPRHDFGSGTGRMVGDGKKGVGSRIKPFNHKKELFASERYGK
jgi:hypothetical protein